MNAAVPTALPASPPMRPLTVRLVPPPRRGALVVLLGLGAALPAGAQRPTRPDSTAPDSTRAVSGITISAPYAPRVTGGASAVVVAPNSLPFAPPAPVLGEALRTIPFLYVRQNSRGENELSIRGSESRQAAVFFEGVPLTLTWDARTDPSIIPLAGIQRLEVVRGLSSLLAGPNAIGGVLSASLWDDPGGSTALVPRTQRIDVQADQFGSTRIAGSLGGTLLRGRHGTLAARGGGGWRNQLGIPRPASVTEPATADRLRLNSDARGIDGFAAARWTSPRGRWVTAALSATAGDRGVLPELHVNAPRLWRNPEVSRQVASFAAGTGAIRSRLGVGDVEVTVGLNRGHVGIASYADRAYARVIDRETGDDRTWTTRIVADQALGRRLAARASYTHADVRYDERLGLDQREPATRYVQRLSSLGAELDVRPTPFVTVTGGVVADRVTTPTAGGRAPQPDTDGTGWRAGATWLLPMQGLRLHASASERRRFPALRELYSGALNRFAPNPALRPETFRGAEAGATLTRGRVEAQAVAFSSRTDDAVIRVTLPDRRFQRVNRDRFTSTGVELLAGVTVGRLTVRADATLQDATITDKTVTTNAEREPENLPRRFGSVMLTGRLPRAVEATARARITGAISCLNPDTNRRDRPAGGTAIDVALERRWAPRGWGRRLRTLVAVDNAGDRALYDQCGLPQPGRLLRVGLGIG